MSRLGRSFFLVVLCVGTTNCLGDRVTSEAGDALTLDIADADAPETKPEKPEKPEKPWPRACPHLYAQDTLPEFHLDFDPDTWAALNDDCANNIKKYRPVRFTYDGETVPAMVRLKGGWSWSCTSMQFVVSFNEDDPQARFHGLRKLNLEASWYDRTLMHERLAYPLFAARGLPYSCVNHATLFVNGTFFGVYSNSEHLDKEYLERNFQASDGNLFLTMNELKTNEDQPFESRMNELKNAVTVDQIAAVVDLDEALAEWAVEAMIPACDNYWAGVEINFYVYEHPTRGFLWLPYDLDGIFGDTVYADGTLVWPDAATADPILWEHTWWGKEALVRTVLSDPALCERFVDEVRRARAVFDPQAMAAQVEKWDAQIAYALARDPHKTWTLEEHAAAIADLETFLQVRADFVDAWLAAGDHCPGVWTGPVCPPGGGCDE